MLTSSDARFKAENLLTQAEKLLTRSIRKTPDYAEVDTRAAEGFIRAAAVYARLAELAA